MSKHLVNAPSDCVSDCLEGLVAVNPGLRILEGHSVIVRSDINDVMLQGKVTLLCGGGSGHEPAHAGYVGPGMLSAAVCGEIFTSPPPDSILAALRTITHPGHVGTLMIIKNYTGDRLNFGLVLERAKAEGLTVEMLVVGDDCALTSTDKTAGRRGLCGTVLINKIAGAMAEDGKSLAEIFSVCQSATRNIGTIGLSLSPCHIPGRGASFQLAVDEMELGLGIHGEAGIRRIKILSASSAVDAMLSHMMNPGSSTCFNISPGTPVTLMVNNLGGTSVLELNIMAKEAIKWLEARDITVECVYCGTFMTSLDMAGISLTLLNMDDDRRRALYSPTSVPAWCRPLWGIDCGTRMTPGKMPMSATTEQTETDLVHSKTVDSRSTRLIEKAISFAAEALGNCEEQLTTLDSQSGDGDCGATMKRGTDEIQVALQNKRLSTSCPRALLLELAKIAESSMGGSSGALYSLMLTAASHELSSDTSAQSWCRALGSGIQAIIKYGGAEPGDRTMLDALSPAHKVLSENLSSGDPLRAFALAVQAAELGAQQTAQMAARAGRASYVGREHLTGPDPGAHAVGIWLRAAFEACKLYVQQEN